LIEITHVHIIICYVVIGTKKESIIKKQPLLKKEQWFCFDLGNTWMDGFWERQGLIPLFGGVFQIFQ
jgi:hypothetical protein